MIKLNTQMIVMLRKYYFWRILNLILLNYLKEISQYFEGNFAQNKEKKGFFGFSKWKH
jgi:hypothetical protein